MKYSPFNNTTQALHQENTPPTAIRRMLGLLGYLAGIGLLLFLLFVILFSLWQIFATA